ncbi:ABC transporter permease [Bacillus fonticola]|uniref:ABC transporter permease n=1 Tax=Bacillus fonticola TaxID=2728853 RepID=UPI0014755E9E|nr:ABC transporter permease [Bacillus fonticola]
MNKFFTVIGHTYLSKLKNKSFIISTVIMMGLVVVVANLSNIMDAFNGSEDGEREQVVVVDEANGLFPVLMDQVSVMDPELELVEGTEDLAALQARVSEGEYEALVVLRADENNLPEATWYANDLMTTSTLTTVETSLQEIKRVFTAQQLDLTAEEVASLNEPVSVERVALEEGAKSEEELNETEGIVYVILFVMYMVVIIYGSMIATEVATEKSSRVMEILVSSVPPVQQMFGKIIGIVLVMITQLGSVLLVGYLTMTQALAASQREMIFDMIGLSGANAVTLTYGIVFLVLGVLLYATLAAFLGSIVSRSEDVQQAIAPMIYIIMIGFFLAIFGLNDPSMPVITVASYIPFFTPLLMFLRVGMLSIPAWEVALGISVLVASIGLLAYFGGRVYKGGVFMYGKTNSWKDIFRAFKMGKES